MLPHRIFWPTALYMIFELHAAFVLSVPSEAFIPNVPFIWQFKANIRENTYAVVPLIVAVTLVR